MVEPAAGGNRVGLAVSTGAFAGQPSVFVEGNGSVVFSGAPFIKDLVPRTIGFTYDGAAGTAKLYVNGALASTVTGLNDHTLNPCRIRIGAFSGVQSFDGEIAWTYMKVGGPVVSDVQMAAAHASMELEFNLAS